MQVPVYEYEMQENPYDKEDSNYRYKGFRIYERNGYFVIDPAGTNYGPFHSVKVAKQAIDTFLSQHQENPFPRNRISIKSTSYRGKKGFLVYGYGPAAIGIQRVFTESKASAERIAKKLRAGERTTPVDFASNPPVPHIVGKIYERCLEIRASKAGMPHECDAKCKAANHRFKHPYHQKACIYALSDGSILIK